MNLLYIDILEAFEAQPDVGQATLRERQLIEVLAERLFRLENELYWARQEASKRPEAGR